MVLVLTDLEIEEIRLGFRRADIFQKYTKEMERQDAKFGPQRRLSNYVWLAILAEEFGEAAMEVNDQDTKKLIEELVQCGAVITQWIDALQQQEE